MYIHGNLVFGCLKQNLNVDQRVAIGRTSDPEMDRLTGKIVGKSGDHICDTYIVLLDAPYNGQKAVSVTEACLCPIDEEPGREPVGWAQHDVYKAADALLGTLWQTVYSGRRTQEENWQEMDRRFPQARWLHNALKAWG